MPRRFWTEVLLGPLAAHMASVRVRVNQLSDPELRKQLVLLPNLTRVAAEAIVRLRPFADAANLRSRVACSAPFVPTSPTRFGSTELNLMRCSQS